MIEKLPLGYKGGYLGGGIISFSGKASTRTRLHELAHKRLGHEPGKVSAKELARREIDAEVWSWEIMGKKPNYKVGLPAYADLIDRFNYEPKTALRIVYSELQKRGIEVNREGVIWYLERAISKEEE